MKNCLLLVIILLVVSCKKELVYPSDQLPSNVPKVIDYGGISRWGEFLLIGSKK